MPGLHLYSSNRQEKLAGRLAALCTAHPLLPFENETILCENKGMARWLSLALAERLGVMAGAQFPYPYRFIWETFGKIFPGIVKEEDSPFNTAIMTWRILRLLPGLLTHPAFEAVARYLKEDDTGLKRHQLAERLAHLYDHYLDYRPHLVIGQWERGKVGEGDERWQAMLWNALLEGTDKQHRARLFANFFARVKAGGAAPEGLPRRISVFGIPFLPPMHLDFLLGLAQYVEIHYFLLNPSRQYWGDLKKKSAPPKGFAETLLTSVGVLGRDFQEQWVDIKEKYEEELFEEPGETGMLGDLQRELLDLSIPETPRQPAARSSIEIHACHTPMREVEVLYDRLLKHFETLPALRPHEIVVMSPEIDTYAPHIRAVLGGAPGGRPPLPFRLSDRAAAAEGEITGFFLALLRLAGGRCEADKVVALLECPAITQKFKLPQKLIGVLSDWVEEAGIRWGIDGEFKQARLLPATEQNTWQAGLRRLLLGYGLPDAGNIPFEGIAPLNLVEGDAGETLGRFLDFLEALFEALPRLSQPRPPSEWVSALHGLLDHFFEEDALWLSEMEFIRALLDGVSAAAQRAGYTEAVSLPVLLHLFEKSAGESAASKGFLSGGITFCSLKPMRSLPFRVVCLLGMDQGKFPRENHKPGFDLVGAAPKRTRGDRSGELDDKYLFLEALLSAREVLHVSYLGRSEVDNLPQEPSLLVRDLKEHLEKRYDGPPLEVVHRLRGSHPDYFSGRGPHLSYSQNDYRAATADTKPAPPIFVNSPLPAPAPPIHRITLTQLADFFSHPSKVFLNERLRIYFPKTEAPLLGNEPFRPEGLEKYRLLNKFLTAPGGFASAESEGFLPHGVLGKIAFETFRKTADELLESLPLKIREAAAPIPVRILLPPFELEGELEASAAGQLFHRPALIKPKDLIHAWIRHLALSFVFKGKEAFTYLAGLKSGKPELKVFRGVENPAAHLLKMAGWYAEGLSTPLPFFPRTSLSYAEKAASAPEMRLLVARQAFLGQGDGVDSGEARDPYVDLCFGGRDPLNTQFESLALEFFGPALTAMERP